MTKTATACRWAPASCYVRGVDAPTRLLLEPVEEVHVDAFHSVATDPHVVRYLMDGQEPPREWSAAQVASSAASFARHGVGLWLGRFADATAQRGATAGFCGFLRLPDTGLGLELVYAVRGVHAGQGLGTELARTAIERAGRAGLGHVGASVDAVNVASVRILERLGFALVDRRAGVFGDLLIYGLELGSHGRP